MSAVWHQLYEEIIIEEQVCSVSEISSNGKAVLFLSLYNRENSHQWILKYPSGSSLIPNLLLSTGTDFA